MAIDYYLMGERLKKARVSKNITQEELAEKLNVSVAFLSRVERGSSNFNLKRIEQVCNVLGITEAEIINGTSKNSSNYLSDDFSELLKNCSPEKQKLIYDVAKVISKS